MDHSLRTSTIVRPLQNRPVTSPVGKSTPLYGKLALETVRGRKLLLPGSTNESPNTKHAGKSGSPWTAANAQLLHPPQQGRHYRNHCAQREQSP